MRNDFFLNFFELRDHFLVDVLSELENDLLFNGFNFFFELSNLDRDFILGLLDAPFLDILDPVAFPVNVFLQSVDESPRFLSEALDGTLPVTFLQIIFLLEWLDHDHEEVLLLSFGIFSYHWSHL